MFSKPFVPLHVHSHYSLLDGLAHIDTLVRRAKEFGMPALALTDHGALYGAIEFYQTCVREGIKPIIGVETYITSKSRFMKNGKHDDERFHLILLASDTTGYKNLMKLVTHASLEGFYYRPRIDFEILAKYRDGIIATSACISGQIGQAILQGIDPLPVLERYVDIFGADHFYLEVQHHPHLPEQHAVNETLIQLSRQSGIGLVATGDSHYLDPDDAQAHDVLLCIQTKRVQSDKNRLCMLGEDFSFTNGMHLSEAFASTPEALTNTHAIAERCTLTIEFGKIVLPEFHHLESTTPDKELRRLCEQGLGERYVTHHSEIIERLEYELSVIITSGFASYFLIVHDFVLWAKKQGIVVGPGRGSAAGSLVSYLLHITNIDPIRYDLLFERFLNPERVSMPDIDLDFADSRRDEVLGYVEQTYGKDHVAQIITFGTMAARVSVRDVGRVLGVPYAFCDSLAKMIPPHATLSQAVKGVPELAHLVQTHDDARRILDIARRLEGVARHTSTHACGVVITPAPLTEYVPCQYASPEDKTVVTQYSLHPIEDLGLLKFDFLGLSNLTILEHAQRIVQKTRGISINYDALPLDDQATFRLMKEGRTTGVFQLESAGMKRYLKDLRPTEFEDIIAMVALYRPGPMELIPDYIASKHGKKTPRYLHPKLEPILKKTYGIAVYQEQLMKIAQELAGFTLGEADVLRKAVGKKIPKLLKQQRNKFIAGCTAKGLNPQLAEQIFEFIEPFANYGFNRSHAACYAMIAYQTAYMKANFPAEFMAALMTADQQNSDRIAIEVEECRAMSIRVLPPDVNESFASFTVVGGDEKKTLQTIRFGLCAIKNIGAHIVDEIIAERKRAGVFLSLEDFLSRILDKDLNKKSLESLIRCGALDRFGERTIMLYNMDTLLSFNKKCTSEREHRQGSLFGFLGKGTEAQLHLSPAPALDMQQKLAWEKELLGLYLSEHPLSSFQEILQRFVTACADAKRLRDGRAIKVCGIITSVKKIVTRKSESMLFARIEDTSDSLEVVVFPSLYKETASLWVPDHIIAVEGRISQKENDTKILCTRAREINEEFIKRLEEPHADMSSSVSMNISSSSGNSIV